MKKLLVIFALVGFSSCFTSIEESTKGLKKVRVKKYPVTETDPVIVRYVDTLYKTGDIIEFRKKGSVDHYQIVE